MALAQPGIHGSPTATREAVLLYLALCDVVASIQDACLCLNILNLQKSM